jgi:hypothetical protein
VQNIGTAHIAANPVARDDPRVALDLDLDVKKECGLATGLLNHELGRSNTALTAMPGKLIPLMVAENKRDTSSTTDQH